MGRRKKSNRKLIIVLVVVGILLLSVFTYQSYSLSRLIVWGIGGLVGLYILLRLYKSLRSDTGVSRDRYRREYYPTVSSSKTSITVRPSTPSSYGDLGSDKLGNVVKSVKEFRPSWISRGNPRGRVTQRLEGGENAANSELARFLRTKGFDVEVEVVLSNGKRADLLVDKKVVIEAKPHLKSDYKKGSLLGEIQSRENLGGYSNLVVIYGDARKDTLNSLRLGFRKITGKDVPIVVLGRVR